MSAFLPLCLHKRSIPNVNAMPLPYNTRLKTRVVGIYVSNDPREDSWAAAIDPTGSVLDHLQIPRNRDAKAKKLKVSADDVTKRDMSCHHDIFSMYMA